MPSSELISLKNKSIHAAYLETNSTDLNTYLSSCLQNVGVKHAENCTGRAPKGREHNRYGAEFMMRTVLFEFLSKHIESRKREDFEILLVLAANLQ